MSYRTMKYVDFKEKNDKAFHDFISKNVFFAFSDEQFKEGLKKFNIKENEVADKLYRYVGGGFMLKSAAKEEKEILKRQHRIANKYFNNYKNLVDALVYEMFNHECGYTGSYTEGLYALGYGFEDLKKDKRLRKAYFQAKRKVWKWTIEND